MSNFFSSETVLRFLQHCYDPDIGAYSSVPGGQPTLYGTCYGLLTRFYLGKDEAPTALTRTWILNCQDPESGYFIGPELHDWSPPDGAKHDREHLLLHLSCTALSTCQQFDIVPLHKCSFAHRFCDIGYLDVWLNKRDMHDAWLEGNNLLYVGQLLVFLRDFEHHPDADKALKRWFEWLDRGMDSKTGLWGTDGQCSIYNAMYGGYHQLLVYYYEQHPYTAWKNLIDTVLALQHGDGGFSINGGGGACEDVDAIDILVNAYKNLDYRRATIRRSLRLCLRQIISQQNRDGGFPYKRNQRQSHMGIQATIAQPNVSCMFPTWFRVHTIALIAEIIPDDPILAGCKFRFNSFLSMGWHQSWVPEYNKVGFASKLLEAYAGVVFILHHKIVILRRKLRRVVDRLVKKKC